MIPKDIVYFSLWLFWGVTAIPAAAFSLFLFHEPPFWPHFSERATFQGTLVWLVFVLWIYALPVGLIVSRNRQNAEKR